MMLVCRGRSAMGPVWLLVACLLLQATALPGRRSLHQLSPNSPAANGDQTTCATNPTCLAKLSVLAAQNISAMCGSFESWSEALFLCVGGAQEPLRPINLLAPEQVKDTLPPLIQEFKAATGFDVSVDYLPLDQLAGQVLDTDITGNQAWDAWILNPIATVDLSQQGMVEPLDGYVAADQTINWSDVERFFRLSSSIYNGSIVGIPQGGKVSTLFYRKDVLRAAGNLPPPNTWDELLYLAKMLNGSDFNQDGKKDYALCFQIFDSCLEDYALLGQILASMTQSQGTKQGWLFDPDAMKALVNNQAMLRALEILQEMLPYMWPAYPTTTSDPYANCQLLQMHFLQGECAFTIKWDEQFKGMQLFDQLANLSYNPWKGGATIGYAQLPGSIEVLDRASGNLVPCSSVSVCPWATSAKSLIDGKNVLVNRAPCSGISGLAGMVNAASPAAYKQAAYQLFSFISNINVSYPLVIGLTPVGPYRTRHLSTTPASLALWEAAGYSGTDVSAFLTNMQTSLYFKDGTESNIALDVRITSSYKYRSLLKDAVARIINGSSPSSTMQQLDKGFTARMSATDPEQLWKGYWAALNIKKAFYSFPPPSSPPPNPRPPRPPPSPITVAEGQDTLDKNSLAAVIACSLIGAAALVAGLFVWGRSQTKRWKVFGQTPPKCGPNTTLLVTDIENSTLLWESIAQDVMNQSVDMHHALVRSLLRKYGGYESATEGDSFIVAFHVPEEALRFAQEFQSDLMKQDWAAELLASPLAACQWAMKNGPAQGATMGKSGLLKGNRPVSTGGLSVFGPQSSLSVVHETTAPTSVQGAEVINPFGRFPSGNASLLDMISGARREAGPSPINKAAAQSALQYFKSQWSAWPPPPDGKAANNMVMVYRGLRVRVGMHSGIYEPEDAAPNKTTGRIQFKGEPLALAKAIGDAGHGGQILMSQAAFERLPTAHLQDLGLILNLGDFMFLKDAGLPSTTVLQAVPPGQENRLSLINPVLRGVAVVSNGMLDAPLGDVSIAFVNLVGASTLLAWDKAVAEEAISVYQGLATELLLYHPKRRPDNSTATRVDRSNGSSYLVELAGGLCLAAFTSPANALVWALTLSQKMKSYNWDEDLLSHELCEPVLVGVADQSNRLDQGSGDDMELNTNDGPVALRGSMLRRKRAQMLFCGPRLKVGIDRGRVHATVNPVTGRMTYRGRVMNRSARVAEKAGSGQVWCSESAWTTAVAMDSVELSQQHVDAQPLGPYNLKGVQEPMHLMAVTMACCVSTASKRKKSICFMDPPAPSSLEGAGLSETLRSSQSVTGILRRPGQLAIGGPPGSPLAGAGRLTLTSLATHSSGGHVERNASSTSQGDADRARSDAHQILKTLNSVTGPGEEEAARLQAMHVGGLADNPAMWSPVHRLHLEPLPTLPAGIVEEQGPDAESKEEEGEEEEGGQQDEVTLIAPTAFHAQFLTEGAADGGSDETLVNVQPMAVLPLNNRHGSRGSHGGQQPSAMQPHRLVGSHGGQGTVLGTGQRDGAALGLHRLASDAVASPIHTNGVGGQAAMDWMSPASVDRKSTRSHAESSTRHAFSHTSRNVSNGSRTVDRMSRAQSIDRNSGHSSRSGVERSRASNASGVVWGLQNRAALGPQPPPLPTQGSGGGGGNFIYDMGAPPQPTSSSKVAMWTSKLRKSMRRVDASPLHSMVRHDSQDEEREARDEPGATFNGIPLG